MLYGYQGSMKTRPGHRDEVATILTSGADGLKAAGCHLYVVGLDATDDVTIWVTEAWDSKEAHDASLLLPETRAFIARAMPLLTGEFTSRETRIAGGLGV
ncbi:antibiotic biosynthesis monooxygenase [Paractinoplanes abujensis]|uniref:Quinol monooxygenase YgiN n=1 Tax=Paractinoplanes abujensis TaxID=882441 RepID=A0A7W7CNA2_9ACTN|nr:antibiotic biosynthesis monooxygenase [Actinoplanes abujensis]MBB4691681.1 quinol monooxygenase YgiN [Actinoplanes abujensis]GID16897.1 antibiotic biosynthesis monooxygenase [Actinoplanes abujensis]